MLVFNGFYEIAGEFPNPVLTIGNFDGVHLGHQNILHIVSSRARQIDGQSFVFTFNPHPQEILNPSKAPPKLSTLVEKLDLFERLLIDNVVIQSFDLQFSTMGPEVFFDMIIRKINPEYVCVGYDFGFGRDRSGSLELLRKICRENKIELEIVSPFSIEGQVCSSSKIRECLKRGDLELSLKLLGRNFSYDGVVVEGDGRGRKIGYPTANMALSDKKLMLPNGVYATIATPIESETNEKYLSVTNIGFRPTFVPTSPMIPVVESHLLNFSKYIYGKKIRLEFVKKIRDEKKFPSKELLIQQIEKDILKAKHYLLDN